MGSPSAVGSLYLHLQNWLLRLWLLAIDLTGALFTCRLREGYMYEQDAADTTAAGPWSHQQRGKPLMSSLPAQPHVLIKPA